jgi:hypothetical protein
MSEAEIIKFFCELTATVGSHFNHRYAYDCFCEDSLPRRSRDVRFNLTQDQKIRDYIADAVREKIARDEPQFKALTLVCNG